MNAAKDVDLLAQARHFFRTGKYRQGAVVARSACDRFPALTDAWLVLGDSLMKLGRLAEAASAYSQAAELEPDAADIVHNLGVVALKRKAYEQAVTFFERAAAMGLGHAGLHRGLARASMMLGDFPRALAAHRTALRVEPGSRSTASDWLYCLSHAPGIAPDELFSAHREIGCALEAPYRAEWARQPADPDPGRPLRLGFVSADLKEHPVARFLYPVLKHLDRQRFSLWFYSNSPFVDARTRLLQAIADRWLQVEDLTDDQLTARVRSDEIDVLFDLSGHTGGNRLGMFARKPAPIQIGWIGYPGTTGLEAIDWRIVDAYIAPPGELDRQFSERLLYLPWYAGFEDVADAPPCGPLPALANGYLTFGSFNRPNKIGPKVLATWAAVLRAVPTARMFLGGIDDVAFAHSLIERLMALGIARERLRCEPTRPLSEYLALHQQVDVLLDTYPFGSGTTVNHALWMGVPLITLEGPTLPQKLGASHLRRAGLGEWVTRSQTEYVALARGLPSRLPELAELRAALRNRLRAHPARDGRAVADGLGQVLRQTWRDLCARQVASP